MKTDYSLEMAARPRSKQVGPVSTAVASLRSAAGMTQQEFAHLLGVAVPTVGRWETGRVPNKRFLKEFLLMAHKAEKRELANIFHAALNEGLDVQATIALGKISTYLGQANSIYALTSSFKEFRKEPLTEAKVMEIADEVAKFVGQAKRLAESFDINNPQFGLFEDDKLIGSVVENEP